MNNKVFLLSLKCDISGLKEGLQLVIAFKLKRWLNILLFYFPLGKSNEMALYLSFISLSAKDLFHESLVLWLAESTTLRVSSIKKVQ